MEFSEIIGFLRSAALVRTLVAFAAMFALLLAYGRRESLPTAGKWLLGLVAAGMASLGMAYCLYLIATNFTTLREWDFLCFWTYSRALALGQSPYDIAVLQAIATPHSPSQEFHDVNICLYPPITLPLFWPFGFLSFHGAMAAWYAVQVAALVASAVLLRRLWDEGKSWLGLTVTLAIFFTWHSTQSTLLYAQTNFLVLLAILGLTLVPSQWWRGICLGLAIVVKPIAAILLIDLAIRHQWRALLAMVVPPLVALGLVLLIQGWPGLASYIHRNPVEGNSAFPYYIGTFNQSLLAVLLRWFEVEPLARPVFFPPYIVLAGILTAATVLVLVRLPRDLSPLGVGYVLALALLVYPGTQVYYSLWLLVPLGLLWRHKDSLASGSWLVPLAIALAFGLTWSRWSFAAHLVTWLAMTALLGYRAFWSSAVAGQPACQDATAKSTPATAATARLTASRTANTTGS